MITKKELQIVLDEFHNDEDNFLIYYSSKTGEVYTSSSPEPVEEHIYLLAERTYALFDNDQDLTLDDLVIRHIHAATHAEINRHKSSISI